MHAHDHRDHPHDDPHQHGDGTHLVFDTPEMAAYAELEAEVLAGFVTGGGAMVAALCERDGVEVRRVLDLGSGPGVGTCGLAERFEGAQVLAVDGSATMLEHVRSRAERLGLGDRVASERLDLADDLDGLGRADVVWVSMALHHVGDEVGALRRIRSLLEPGGLVAIVEVGDPLRIVGESAELGSPGLWERLEAAWAAWFADMRAGLPGATRSASYPAMLEDAGLDLVAHEVITVELVPPLDAPARRFAHRHLVAARTQLADRADPADLAELDALVADRDEEGILRRDDLRVRASRHLYVARSRGPG